jgi:hypothetical protein
MKTKKGDENDRKLLKIPKQRSSKKHSATPDSRSKNKRRQLVDKSIQYTQMVIMKKMMMMNKATTTIL